MTLEEIINITENYLLELEKEYDEKQLLFEYQEKFNDYFSKYLSLVNIYTKDLEEAEKVIYIHEIIHEYMISNCTSSSLQDRIFYLTFIDEHPAIYAVDSYDNKVLIASCAKKLFTIKKFNGDLCWGYKGGSSTVNTALILLNEVLINYRYSDRKHLEMARVFADEVLYFCHYDNDSKIEEKKITTWVKKYIKDTEEFSSNAIKDVKNQI